MIAFHVDMKMALLRPDALKALMAECAKLGYDTLVWEVEDAVAWETVPEAASPGAYTKAEFKALLTEGTRLGLAHVPLFQTLGHAEYVLRHERYAALRENADAWNMYCPLNRDVLPLLHRWIAEYRDLFGPVKDFHIGADETWNLGTCPACKAFAAEHSKSRLFIDHVNAVAAPLLADGIRPIVWDDMLLRYPEALERLDRRIAVMDWLYTRHEGCGKAHVFGFGTYGADDLPPEIRARYGRAMFPEGEEAGRDPDPFFGARHLAAAGHAVITAPGSSSAGDSVFTTRNWMHVINSWDSARRGMAYGGVLETSWSIRLNPYDVQMPAIAAAAYAARHPKAGIGEFQRAFERDRFGAETPAFWPALALLSTPCLFSASQTLGFNHPPDPVPADQVKRVLRGLVERQEVAKQAEATLKRLADYREARARLAELKRSVKTGQAFLDVWEAAARQLEGRAEIALLFLESIGDVLADQALAGSRRDQARGLLKRHRELKADWKAFLLQRIKPERVPQYLGWMFDRVETPLARLAGE